MPQPPPARKSLGQHFLRDEGVARRIVRLLHLDSEDLVVEVGPGPGMLTGLLRDAFPASLILVEKDPYWAEIRRAEAADRPFPPVSVITVDALRHDWSSYASPCKIIGNLPYNIASPLMWDLFSMAGGLRLAVFMVQKEVGLRLTAAPGGKSYGALSAWVRNFCNPRLEFLVPPQVFIPKPKVWSAVLSFFPLPPEERPAKPESLAYLLRIFFQQRRKQLGVILRGHGHTVSALEECGINPADRPEALFPEQFKRLSDFFSKSPYNY